MSKPLTIPPGVIALQTSASDPAQSAWVSANAGSGKTHVLAQRVIRLLLTGNDPARILCITFTKAAAANMANRVFDVLRGWTVLDDDALDKAIASTGVKAITPALRLRARQLFALALDTPGGLKVQTIHAFCTQLLHLFPFEANVPARFEVLDEATEHQLLHKLTMDVLLEAAQAPETPLGRALRQAVLAAADQTFQEMVRNAIRERDDLTRWIEAAGGIGSAAAQLSAALGIRPEDSAEAVDAALFAESVFVESEWPALADALDIGLKSDKGHAQNFRSLAALDATDRIDVYIGIFCTDKGTGRKNFPTKGLHESHPDVCVRLVRERDRIEGLLKRKAAVEARDRSMALFTIAYAVIGGFQKEKNRRGLLDYDDLIDKTLALLTEVSAAWVHYKLDSGIHHVLIDEAQDTSPKQWAIVKALVSEFFAGKGVHDRKRTIFAVGDEKQSIFSFQGAAPKEFADNRLHFKMLHERAEFSFEGIEFKTSFRSGANVLDAVDTVFKSETAHAGLSADNVGPVHESLPDKAPGLVELWDLTEADLIEKKPGWNAPFDLQTARSAPAKLAERIARTIAVWCARGRSPKDVLILVRQRGPLFEAIIRALKQANVPVAGADRLVLTEHIAVMDLMVLADALLLPEDDLALATVLKSPLFGLDDAALEQLAYNRGRISLYASLRAKMPEQAARFDTLRAKARELSPFAFYAWLLGAHDGRRQFLSRLGHEAADALDEFLNLALDYEARETPTLQGFVAWLRAAEAEVKRDMEMERDEVRVMTVHGAKGLEAPFVVLADTTTKPEGAKPPKLLVLKPDQAPPDAAAPLVWAVKKANDSNSMATAREATLREATDEYRRLLYVAMTRAADQLTVCGIKGDKKIPDGCWYQLVDNALGDLASREKADDGVGDGDGTVRRYRKPDPFAPAVPPDDRIVATPAETAPAVTLPPWLTGDAPRDVSIRTITPSGFDESAPRPLPTTGQNNAMLRGSLVHRLLQSLPGIPAERRLKAAQDYLAREGTDLSAADHASLTADVMRVLDDARFRDLFGPGSRAEVPIVGLLDIDGETRRINGQVDRLVVTTDWVLIADYKTNRPAPRNAADAPQQYVRQLALYRAVLSRLYPGRPVRCALIWTEVPDLMELSSEALDHAMAAVTSAR